VHCSFVQGIAELQCAQRYKIDGFDFQIGCSISKPYQTVFCAGAMASAVLRKQLVTGVQASRADMRETPIETYR